MSVRVRMAVLDDAPAIQAIYAPIVRDTVISFEAEPPSIDEIRQRLTKIVGQLPWLVAEDADRCVLGYAYASRHRERTAYQWSAEVSVYVDETARRRGIGQALYGALIASLTAQG